MNVKRLFPILGIFVAAFFQSMEVHAADAAAALASDLESLRGEAVFAAPGDGARSYQRTARGDFAKGSFMAEVTVTLKGGGGSGCAFFGIGRGAASSQHYGEPATTPAVFARLAPNDFGGGLITVSVDGQEANGGSDLVGDGTHRERLTWDATTKRALFEVCRNWDRKNFRADSSVMVSATTVNFGEEAHLFIGGAHGVKFSDFSVRPLSAQEIKAANFGENFANDSTAGTWLPVESAAKNQVRPLACWYNGPKLAATRTFMDGAVRTDCSRWTCDVRETPADGGRDMTATFRITEGTARAAGAAVAFDFADWSTNNYVLIPASVYNGNRNRIVGRGYAEGLDPGDYYRKDLPLTHGSVPCLSQETGKPSKLEVSACNAAIPAVCIFEKKAKRGFILLAEQAGRGANGDFLRKSNGEIIDNAFAVEESADRSHATLVVSAPGVRERMPEFIGFGASPDRGIAMKAGDVVELRLRVYSFAAADIPAVFEKLMTVRKSVTGPNHPRNLLPESEHGKRLCNFTDGRFLNSPKAKFYMPENGDWIVFGWIGGWINTFPMLALGDTGRLERVTQTFDFGLKAQEPSGYFHYAIRQDKNVTFREPKPDMNLARTEGDTLFWMIKQFQLLKAQGRANAIKSAWEASMKKLAAGLVSTWRKDGQWGKMINVKTGDVSEYNSSGGVMVIGGLALAADYFKNPEYLAVAKEAAEFYYQRDFVKQGQITGACADILQNADSETAFGFTTSLMALYETTGDKAWLEKSRNLANLAATWTVSYDYELPKFTALGALGTKLAGAVWASTQNKHAAPGICCSSGDPLFKIYRATGDTRYAELMRDILHAHADAIWGGGGSERLTYCDADSRGDNPPGCNGWVATDGALMTLEIPGVYLRTDKDEMYVFDSVESQVVKRDRSGVTLQIKNPTKYPAGVSICAENSAQSGQPLGCTAFLKWPHADLVAGESATFQISTDGRTVKKLQ